MGHLATQRYLNGVVMSKVSQKDKKGIYDKFEDDIISPAQWQATDVEKLVLLCRILANEGHSDNLAGQVTIRRDKKSWLTLRIGPMFDEVVADDVCVVDESLNLVEGTREVNPALRFHMWLYRAKPQVRCVIHTHPPYTSALSMIGEPLVVSHMDTAMFHDDCAFLAEWPGVPFSDDEGRIISETIGDKRSILLAHHGYVTTGATVEEATYLAVFLERAARMQLLAQSAGAIKAIRPEFAQEAHDFLLKPAVVNATFEAWARRARS